MAGVPFRSTVPAMRPSKRLSMIERHSSPSPTAICPRAAMTAIRADTQVPVGERSILPGWMATAWRVWPFCTGVTNPQKLICVQSGLVGWLNPSCSFAALVIFTPRRARSAASSGVIENPSAGASTSTKLSPPNAVSMVIVPSPATSNFASRCCAKEGRFCTVIRCALPFAQSARTRTSPPGASSVSSVTGSTIGMIPPSSNTVDTQMELDPDMGGVSSGSMMIKAASASGCLGGTSRFTCRNTPPRGSFRTKLRRVSSCAIHLRWSHRVAPGGGVTPPTITSPTSPSAWQEMT